MNKNVNWQRSQEKSNNRLILTRWWRGCSLLVLKREDYSIVSPHQVEEAGCYL